MDSGSAPRARKGIDFSSLRWNSRRVAETLLIGAIGGIIFDAVRFPAGWLAGAMVFCAGAALAVRGAGDQHREDLLLVLVPELPGIPGQQSPVGPLQVLLIGHVAIPPARSSRFSATAA